MREAAKWPGWPAAYLRVLPGTPEAYGADIAAEQTKWSAIIKKSAVKRSEFLPRVAAWRRTLDPGPHATLTPLRTQSVGYPPDPKLG